MTLPANSLTLAIAIIAVLIGTLIVFGHRCADKASKYDEKQASDELNDIRYAVRTDNTIPALNNFHNFVWNEYSNGKRQNIESSSYIESMFYDIAKRRKLNDLINKIEDTFRESMTIKLAWSSIRVQYSELSKWLYGFALVIGVGGYSLLYIGSMENVLIVDVQLVVYCCVLYCIAGIAILVVIIYKRRKLLSNLTIYRDYKDKYSTNNLRVE